MKRNVLYALLILPVLLLLPACEFLGTVFKTGVGVGVFIVVMILIAIFLISRWIRRR